jgi:hypothetical protein
VSPHFRSVLTRAGLDRPASGSAAHHGQHSQTVFQRRREQGSLSPFIVIRWGMLLGSDSRNASSFRLLLLLLPLCLFAELLDFHLLERLQLVKVLDRILSRVNCNPTRQPVVITCLALLLLVPMLASAHCPNKFG